MKLALVFAVILAVLLTVAVVTPFFQFWESPRIEEERRERMVEDLGNIGFVQNMGVAMFLRGKTARGCGAFRHAVVMLEAFEDEYRREIEASGEDAAIAEIKGELRDTVDGERCKGIFSA